MTGILGNTFKTKENITITVSKFMLLSVAYSDRQITRKWASSNYDTFRAIKSVNKNVFNYENQDSFLGGKKDAQRFTSVNNR